MALNIYVVNRKLRIYSLVSSVTSITNVHLVDGGAATDMFFGDTYRDTGWLLPGAIAISMSQDDGTTVSGSNEARIPDEIMHTSPRQHGRKITVRKYTTADGSFEIPLKDWGGDYAAAPTGF